MCMTEEQIKSLTLDAVRLKLYLEGIPQISDPDIQQAAEDLLATINRKLGV